MQNLIVQFGDTSVLADFINKILNLVQLIDKILVSKAEKVDGEYVQKIQIFYRFIGPLDAIE